MNADVSGTEVHELHFFLMVDNFCRLVLKEIREFHQNTAVKSITANIGFHCGQRWSPRQRSVESTALFSGIHCMIRMFKVFDSGIEYNAG